MRLIIVVMVGLASMCDVLAEEKVKAPVMDPKEGIAVGCTIVNIPGTKLEVFSNYNSQEKSGWTEHYCSIGYSTDRYEKDEEKRKWLIDLAPLQNDYYKIIFKDGIIVVTTEKGGREVVKLNLKAIDPGAILKEE